MDADPVDSLPGLGPKSAEWLRRVGVVTAGDLRACGVVVAYLRVESAGLRPGLNLLWAMHGALAGKPWTEVTAAEKERLLAELSDLRDA